MRTRPTLALAAALLAQAVADGARAASPLAIGFLDGIFSVEGLERSQWMARAAESGSDILRIDVGWPVRGGTTRPAGFDARDPADPAYDFSRADDAIVDANEEARLDASVPVDVPVTILVPVP